MTPEEKQIINFLETSGRKFKSNQRHGKNNPAVGPMGMEPIAFKQAQIEDPSLRGYSIPMLSSTDELYNQSVDGNAKFIDRSIAPLGSVDPIEDKAMMWKMGPTRFRRVAKGLSPMNTNESTRLRNLVEYRHNTPSLNGTYES